MPKTGLSLSDYAIIFRKRGWIIIITFAAILVSTIIHTNSMQPIYSASSSVRILERKTFTSYFVELLTSPGTDLMESQAKVVTSQPVMEMAVLELGLLTKDASSEQVAKAVLNLQRAVTTEQIEKTNIIKITAVHTDPEMVARIANKVAESYINHDAKEKSEQARKVRIFVEEQLSEVTKRLQGAEERLKEFKEKEAVTGIALSIQKEINDREAERRNLTKLFTENYPDVIKIDEQIKSLKDELRTLPEGELEFARLMREVEVNEKSYRGLKGRLDEARIAEAEGVEDVKIVNSATVPTQPIKPNKRLNIAVGSLVGLVMGFFLSFVVESLDTSLGTIEDVEGLIKLPVLTVVPYIRSKEERKRRWGHWREKKPDSAERLRSQLLFKFDPRSPSTEAYRILRTNLKVNELLKNNEKILLFTSTGPDEGKTLTSINLAIALAQEGHKTLLIDADLRKSLIHKVFGIKREPGLSDILIKSTKIEDAVRTIVDIIMGELGADEVSKAQGIDNLNLLTSGTHITNPSEVLYSPKLDETLGSLKNMYDLIVIDVPPILPVPDSLILASKAAGVYLVYRSGSTSRMALLRAKSQMEAAKAALKGIVLNCMTPQAELMPDYYYYYRYKYYTEEKPGKPKKAKEAQ